MTNENNATQGKHLESLAAATKRYILAQILDVTDAVIAELGTVTPSGSSVLDTVPSSVNGGLWYEVANGTPVVKIYYGGNEYPLGSGALEPTLTVAPSPLNVPVDGSASATISCDSGGNYLVTSLTEGVTAELVDNVITVNHVLGIEEASIKIRVMASSGFNAAEILLPVAMAKASPNLTVTPSANIVPCAGVVTAPVSYSGGGTISVSSDNVNITPTYDANTQTITVPYNAYETSATITVTLTASTGYTAASTSFTVTMAEPETILTITPSAGATKGDTITATVSCNSGGSLSVDCDNSNIDWSWDGETITLPFHLFSQDTYVTVTVSAAAHDIYPAATKSFTVTYFGGTSDYLSKLTVCAPFNNNLNEDLCGNTWSVLHGSPQIENGVLHLHNEDCLAGRIPFDSTNGLTISFWIYFVRDTFPPNNDIIHIGSEMKVIEEGNDKWYKSEDKCRIFYWPTDTNPEMFHNGSGSIDLTGISNKWCHFELDWAPDTVFYTFLNGRRGCLLLMGHPSPESSTYFYFGDAYYELYPGRISDYYIANLKISPYCTHTGNFTCPQAPPLPTIT